MARDYDSDFIVIIIIIIIIMKGVYDIHACLCMCLSLCMNVRWYMCLVVLAHMQL